MHTDTGIANNIEEGLRLGNESLNNRKEEQSLLEVTRKKPNVASS